jgi:hypothetical protein
MYRSIKVSEETYKAAKSLGSELAKEGALPGISKVNMSDAVGYALEKALENVKRKKILRETAGAWKDEDTDKLIADIYGSRRSGKRPPAKI